ncbi:COG4186 Predicted phosphoesterase or phosphohydrolase [uncultured Caudovirales phage]|uniref:COG4186 Predicted phosphoesterase or phosphohydrolase n=1 Tax=uncultured Caudovirales phage TaxID=2100421 RepID=A0A6J5L2A8_9CAUD|nr:COG4186 Predicted phosphoesterase or phosphohydrolase [uncultured Caudovirales phage]
MKERWVVSDTHFGHSGVCKFTHQDTGIKIRPWVDVEEMNEDMVRMWNEVVNPCDRVYHLGDVVMNKQYLPIMDRLNGKKVLIKGNHDIFDAKEYLKYFEDVRAYTIYEKVIMSHIPVHPDTKERWKMNIHGHLHTNVIEDPWYQNVSVEQIGFKPILLEEVMNRNE